MSKTLFIRNEGGIRPWVLYAAVGIVVIVGGYLIHGSWTSGDKPLESPWMCMTEGCGHAESRKPKLGDPAPPQICPKCGKKSLVPPQICPNCNEMVIVNEWRGLPPPTICPKCGGEVYLPGY